MAVVAEHRARRTAGAAGPGPQAVLAARARRRHAPQQQAALHAPLLAGRGRRIRLLVTP